ncbi:MAG: hypothetical protein GXO91_06615 [FCB group bacterium]|nr:hypothetical protein [FCB group bacterium]
MPERNKILGIALGGGGARGLTHIGILAELKDRQLAPDMITGTSIGAVIGAMYAATLDPVWIAERIKSFIDSDEYKKVGLDSLRISGQSNPSIFQTATNYVKQHVMFSIANDRLGLLRIERLQSVIEYMLPVKTFDQLRIPFKCSALDLNTGRDVVFDAGDLVEALTATSAVTGFIQPLVSGKYLLTDGGASQPIPLKLLQSMGPDVTIAVDVNLRNFRKLKNPNILQVLSRAEQVSTLKLSGLTCEAADVVILPETLNINWSEFGQVDTLVENGRKAVCNQLENIESKLTFKEPLIKRILRR